jgi:dihydrodipicolinate synthase/N-acetylneuraminate lyase
MLTRQSFVGPWAGLPVAWTDNDEFDEETYRGDVARCCQVGVPGVYTGGTTGEFYAQEWDEFQRIARSTVEECHRHSKPAMIGCTSTSTRGTCLRAAFAAGIGADAIQIAFPFWMAIADDQILPFVEAVAKAACGLPLSIYETKRAKKTLSIEQHFQIHRAVPQYMMVKATKDTVADTVEGCGKLSEIINVFVGEHRWAELGPVGAIGCCSSVVYWSPHVLLRSWTHLENRDWQQLQADCGKLNALFAGLFEAFGTRGFTDTAFDRLGGQAGRILKTSLRNREPYAAPNESDVQTMRELFQKHFPEMLRDDITTQ